MQHVKDTLIVVGITYCSDSCITTIKDKSMTIIAESWHDSCYMSLVL